MPFLLSGGKNKRWIRLDQDDFGTVSGYRWQILPNGYASRTVRKRSVYLHRLIMGLEHGDGLQVDHINGNALDNRKCNMRVVTHAQNQQNQPNRRGSSSRYRGVFLRTDGRWQAEIHVAGKTHRLGIFDDEDAAGARVQKHRLDYQPYAVLERCVG